MQTRGCKYEEEDGNFPFSEVFQQPAQPATIRDSKIESIASLMKLKTTVGVAAAIGAAYVVYNSSDDSLSPESIGAFKGEENYFKTSDGMHLWLNSWAPADKVHVCH